VTTLASTCINLLRQLHKRNVAVESTYCLILQVLLSTRLLRLAFHPIVVLGRAAHYVGGSHCD